MNKWINEYMNLSTNLLIWAPESFSRIVKRIRLHWPPDTRIKKIRAPFSETGMTERETNREVVSLQTGSLKHDTKVTRNQVMLRSQLVRAPLGLRARP